MSARRFRMTAGLLTALVVTLAVTPSRALAQTVDQFAIAYGDTVSDGVPAPGAGNLESPGSTDVYTFTGAAGDRAILDVLSGRNTDFLLRFDGPGGSTLFDGIYVDRAFVLPNSGTYTLTIRGFTATSTGAYSWQLLLTPPGEQFVIAIGDTVSDGAPAPGAGNLEAPGAVDTYTFDATAGQPIVLDALGDSTNVVRWALTAPDGTGLFDSLFVDRQFTPSQTGAHTLTVSGLNLSSSGTYSFRIADVPARHEFAIAIGDTVSDGAPAPGAGNLEAPGAIDAYTFDATAGHALTLDAITGNPVDFSWTLTSPAGQQVFTNVFADREVELPTTGTYTLTVHGTFVTSSGLYSFRLSGVPGPQRFAIAVGDTVSDGVPTPGAGNLEAPGAVDIYTFDATVGQTIVLDALAGNPVDFSWMLTDPAGDEVFTDFLSDREVELGTTGAHALTVHGTFVASSGPYSFRLGTPPVNAPPVAVDDEAGTDDATPVTIDVLANDTDPDGDALTIDAVSAPANGTVRVIAGGIEYSPTAGFGGDDQFTYTIGDEHGATATATVTVTVTVAPPPNSPPAIAPIDDRASVEGDAVDVGVSASDPDGDPLTFGADGLPAGVAIDRATGRLTGTIAAGAAASSPYTANVTATDPDGASASTSFTWTVTEPDQPEPGEPIDVRVKVWPSCVWSGFGFVKVVIFGSADVPASRIDASTVALAGMPVVEVAGRPLALRADLDGDGRKDLVALVHNVRGVLPIGTHRVSVSAQLTDGTPVAGTDRLVVLPLPWFWHWWAKPTLDDWSR